MSLLFKAQKILGPLLDPASKAYSAMMSCRAAKYARGEYEQFRPACPCISVGNIGSGGSGKTPLSGWLLNWAKEQGHVAVLLTRGYGARPSALPYLVGPHSPVGEAGDEPLMLAMENPEARIVVDPVRKRSGAWATDEFKPDLMLLDDGFQHMAVKRDLDFVLLTPDDFTQGWDRVIPRGTWREGADALFRADVFFVKCTPEYFRKINGLVKERLSRFGKPVFQFALQSKGLVRLGESERIEFGHGPYLLFSGIGKPEMFLEDAKIYMGQAPEDFLIFKDHHSYTAQDVETIRRRAAESGAKKIICTPKDAVKLAGMGCDDYYVIDLEVEFTEAVFFDDTKPVPFNKWWSLEKLDTNCGHS
ncbi:tetraacyldisaccharide 4'-kinase [Maridesulfovibrio sp. FT414]|uniref:tetraacyldisaccharide 4'-kinase n=1 Tax=Maridesulfovibrio sp. FT414 TaxID=2979469 RepID=UPI003D807BD3